MKLQKCYTRGFIQIVRKLRINFISAVFIIIFSFILLSGSGQAATYTATTCSDSDVKSAISIASSGDTVLVPAGSCEWSASSPVAINKSITLQGNGIDSTVISTTGTSYTNVVSINAASVTVRGFTFTQKNEVTLPY